MASNDHETLGFLLVTLARRWRRVLDHELAKEGHGDASWAPLIHLSLSGDGISQTELAARAGLDTSSLVRLLDRLEERGLIERQIDPQDRRARRIVLTAQAHSEIARIRARLATVEADMLADLNAPEITSLGAGLMRIARRIETMQARDDGADQ